HYEVVAFAQLMDKWFEVTEVVTVIGVTHDDVFAARRRDAAHESAAISLLFDVYHARAQLVTDLLRAVGAAVIGHDNLARYTHIPQAKLCLLYAGTQCLCLV